MGSRQRRRYHGGCAAPGAAPGAAACLAAALLLLMLAFHCVLSPPLGDGGRNDPPRPQGPTFVQSNNPGELRRNVLAMDTNVHASNVLRDGSKMGEELWDSGAGNDFYGCSNASTEFAGAEANTESNRYLMIEASGGLNQQRTGIIDAVIAARILKATLVIPKLDQKSFWEDSSDFADIFDADYFISSLSEDVKIIWQLPDTMISKKYLPYKIRVPRKCTPFCYENRVLPALSKKNVVQLTKFDYRVSNRLETYLQKLRCRVNYHALRFTDAIHEMGGILVQRMREKSGGRFIALHLRFEPDMLAFSGCYYGGGETERRELGTIRKRWKTLHEADPDRERRHGKCPLTPEEVGLMLRALGFGRGVHMYVASGDVYGGEETLAPLKALFPNFYSKETLASKEELEPFLPFSSRMAALDFVVCDQSNVFVTNNNGNMARMLAGRRRYFGHKRTIRPNTRKLNSLFLNRTSMSWDTFASKVQTFQKGFMGEPNEVEPGRGGFYEYPLDCICQKSKARTEHTIDPLSKDTTDIMENHLTNREGRDVDFMERTLLPAGSSNETEADYSHGNGLDIPEMDDVVSD
ncbi:protein ROOT HAIR SPECIFIC 17-like isoform X1 [Panicum hallii]|uniref:protein ROOT HAIR SPECIFIC 17-like isoform X1 n=1 Tax=Panicum hallii TaxID=206008 RepID=UPI000DF4E26E|nr:protein ROOT HAIR SPECIFIC 17-like isoform X1 [Panicum hallii]